MKRIFIGLVVCLFFISCATYWQGIMDQPPKGAPADLDYLTKALAMPLTFSVPNAKAEEVWGRINVFISKYSSMKIQIATNYNVETYNPTDIIEYGYSASRLLKGDETEFTVNCFSGGSFGQVKNIPNQNAHILAYYALTGEIVEYLIFR